MLFQINQIVKVGNDYGRVCAFSRKIDSGEDDDIMYNIWWFENAKTSWINATKISGVNECEEKQFVK
jgi:hypothetical protein